VALVRNYVSEERIASIIRVTRIGEVGTTLAVTSSRRTLSTLFLASRFCHSDDASDDPPKRMFL
jgi:hypothetical protein